MFKFVNKDMTSVIASKAKILRAATIDFVLNIGKDTGEKEL